MNTNKILDVLLLSKSFYQRFTDKRSTLFWGIFLVGLMDIIFILSYNNGYIDIFSDKPQAAFYFNIAYTVFMVFLLGLVDVLFFSLPLYDLFKFFKKEEQSPGNQGSLIKILKIYIMANFLVIPINILSILLGNRPGIAEDMNLINILSLLYVLLNVWFCAAVARGINSIYNFQPSYKRLVFMVVYIWNFFLSSAFQYAILHWILAAYK